MGGAAASSGATYQTRVVAFVYVHILAQMRLGWLSLADDTPLAVSGKTGGPWERPQIEFGERHPAIEVQAKRGLTAGATLREVIDRILSKSPRDDQTLVVLAVNRESSRKVYCSSRLTLGGCEPGEPTD